MSSKKRWLNGCLLLAGGLACTQPAWAAEAASGDVGAWLSMAPVGRADVAQSLRVFWLLTALSLLPALLICVTAFTRIVIVLSMLRHAIGLQDSPPNVVILTLALFLTLFTMQPVIHEVNQKALQPYAAGQMSTQRALDAAVMPMKDFMVRQTRQQDLSLMLEMAKAPMPQSLNDVALLHLIPAFMLSELRAAFQIGFMIFLPFLLVDLICASGLMALGMMMVPPATISLPIKLLLFVLIDGWNIVTRALVSSFH